MYIVREHASRRVLSIHRESESGLRTAITEANMRTHARQTPYEVVDDNNYRLHIAYPDGEQTKKNVATWVLGLISRIPDPWQIVGMFAIMMAVSLYLRR